jgi:hypothetical protein
METPLPGFIPGRTGTRRRAGPRLLATLAVLAAYVGSAALQDGPIQVWLLALAPFALAAIATALHVIEPSEPR